MENPDIICMKTIYNPFINYQGKVCVTYLNKWKERGNGNLFEIFDAVNFLFIDSNLKCDSAETPLNHVAAQHVINNFSDFQTTVKKTLVGGSVQLPNGET